jgi:hypothetical protein
VAPAAARRKGRGLTKPAGRHDPCAGEADSMARLVEIVVDSDHPAALARFWAAVLDGHAVAPYDDAEIARLAAQGLTPETDPVVMVDGPGPRLCFHLMPGPRLERSRWHLDLTAARGCWRSARPWCARRRVTSFWPTRRATASAC